MENANDSSRINLRELRLHMETQVGSSRTQQYFSYLNGLLSRKFTKPEFDKLCIFTLGQENLFLHNQLIRSVFQNACQQRVGRPDQSLQPAPPIWYNAPLLHVFRENGELGISDLKHLVKRQRVEENTIPVSVPVLPPQSAPVSIPVRPSPRKVKSSRSLCETDFLASNEELKRRLDDIARENGLEGGATLECAQLLNTGVDLYLRRVIRSSLDLVYSRARLVNGTRNGTVSIQDFRVAMEMNPQQLGRDWPLLFENLSCHWFESKD